ncbi:hypothetical protein [Halobacteriovorax sp.]|uniref:glutamine amidotransferase-related protein n=1 Tax=Halobacteriovorax sp. TaxID=2020862 RepID=UPI003561E608
MKVAIIDFDDSFTFNIYSILKDLRVEAYVIDFKKVQIDFLSDFTHVLLGPGPGHVDDYDSIFPLVDKLILDSLSERYKLLGICLGHQLIHYRLGREIKLLNSPIHGQSFKFKFPISEYLSKELQDNELQLQFYNSWGVVNEKSNLDFDLEIHGHSDEIIASFSKNITTYQFHCESVGTSCQRDLFHQMLV